MAGGIVINENTPIIDEGDDDYATQGARPKNPFDCNLGGGDGIENMQMYSTRRGSVDVTNPFTSSHAETSFIDGDEHTHLIQREIVSEEWNRMNAQLSRIERERRIDKAWDTIKRKYPKFSPENFSFTASIDDYDRVTLKRLGGRTYTMFKPDGELNDKLPKKIKENLGPPAEEVRESNEAEISRRTERVIELESTRSEASENQRESIDHSIEEERTEIESLQRENEDIQEKMSLRDKIKMIFKKYGLTAFSVLSAVGVIIGVIVSNLKNGLATLGRALGNGLKAIGKKLGQILPGMVGTIASFIFRTVGEVIGFLGKHDWLLIVAVVMYAIEQFKKKRS